MTREQLTHLHNALTQSANVLADASQNIDDLAFDAAREEIAAVRHQLLALAVVVNQELRLSSAVDLLIERADRDWHAEPIPVAAGRVA